MIKGVESAKLKIARAWEHLAELLEVARVYTDEEIHKLSLNSEGQEVLEITRDPPPRISVLVGEIVYQVRSALDHLTYEIVEANQTNIVLPKNWVRDCTFPLMLKAPIDKATTQPYSPPVPYSVFEKTLPGLTPQAFKFIEALQPYWGQGTSNLLKIVGQLSNIDKHRHLHITIPRISVRRRHELADGMQLASSRGGYTSGSVIEPPESNVWGGITKTETDYRPYVTFAEPTVEYGPSTMEVQEVFRICLEQVEDIIIPGFEDLLSNCVPGNR
jgi:hypothetical protein